MRIVVESRSPEDTETLGRRLGARLQPRDVVALIGPLGAGKTVLARGIAEGAGARGYIASPSFVMVREYRGRLRIYHADLYRLERVEDVRHLGLDELAEDGALVVEWADRALDLLPPDHIRVECALGASDTERRIVVTAPAALAGRLSDLEETHDARPGC